MSPSEPPLPPSEDSRSTSTSHSTQSQQPTLLDASEGPEIFLWGPPPKQQSWATSSAARGQPQPQPQPHPPAHPHPSTTYAPPSRKAFVPSAGSGGSQTNLQGDGEQGGSLISSNRRADSIESPEVKEPGSTRPPTYFASVERRGQHLSHSPPKGSKGPIDLSHLRLDRGGTGSPIPPALHRSPPPPSASNSSQKRALPHLKPSPEPGQIGPRPHAASTIAPRDSDRVHPPLASSTAADVQRHDSSKASVETKKRARSEDNPQSSAPRNSSGPLPTSTTDRQQRQPRAHTTGSGAQGGLQRGGGTKESQTRKISSSTRQSEVDSQGIFGAVSEMMHHLKAKDIEIFDLKEQLEELVSQVNRASQEKEVFKKEVSERTRSALAKVEATNQNLVETYKEVRDAIGASKKLGTARPGEMIEELRRDLEGLKKDVGESAMSARGKAMLEKNEEAKIQVLHELQNHLADRDRVIKLLRTELETRTGELLEARETISVLAVERQVAYTRIDHLSTEVDSTRSAADSERQKLRDEIDRSKLEAAEIEQAHSKKIQDVAAEWSDLLLEAKKEEKGLQAAIERLKGEAEEKEEKINHDWKLKLQKLETEYHSQAQVAANAYAEEQAKLLLDLKVARAEAHQVSSLKNEAKSLTQELVRAQNNVQALIDSAQRDQEALRDSRAEAHHLRSDLDRKAADVDNYEVRLFDLQHQLATAEASASAVSRAEIEQVKLEKLEALSAKDLAKQQLADSLIERDSLVSNISRLESSLATARETIGSLELQVSELSQQLARSDSKLAILQQQTEQKPAELHESAENASISKLESAMEELDRLHQVEEELESVRARSERDKEEYARERVTRMRLDLQDAHSIATMNLQNENKRLKNRNEEMERKINRMGTDLAKAQGKQVLNPNSSSLGSTQNGDLDNGGGGEGGGTAGGDAVIEFGGAVQVSREVDSQDIAAIEAQASTAPSATLVQGSEPSRTSSLTPAASPGGVTVTANLNVAGPADADENQGLSISNPAAILSPQSGAHSRLRKRSIDTAVSKHDENVSTSASASTSKRARRTVSNENKGPAVQASRGDEGAVVIISKPKTRVQNKYNVTTKKKK